MFHFSLAAPLLNPGQIGLLIPKQFYPDFFPFFLQDGLANPLGPVFGHQWIVLGIVLGSDGQW